MKTGTNTEAQGSGFRGFSHHSGRLVFFISAAGRWSANGVCSCFWTLTVIFLELSPDSSSIKYKKGKEEVTRKRSHCFFAFFFLHNWNEAPVIRHLALEALAVIYLMSIKRRVQCARNNRTTAWTFFSLHFVVFKNVKVSVCLLKCWRLAHICLLCWRNFC